MITSTTSPWKVILNIQYYFKTRKESSSFGYRKNTDDDGKDGRNLGPAVTKIVTCYTVLVMTHSLSYFTNTS